MAFRRKIKRRAPGSGITKSRPKTTSSYLKRRQLTRKKNLGKTRVISSDPPAKKQRKKTRLPRGPLRQIKRILFILIMGGFSFLIIYQLFLSQKLNIQTIAVFEDQQPQSDHEIINLLQEYNGTNLLLFDANQIEDYLKTQYPYYSKLKLSKNLPDTIVITIENHPIVANLMVKLINENGTKEKNLFLNTAGMITDLTENNDNDMLELPTLQIEIDQPLTQGDQVLSQEDLAFILEAMQNYEDKFGMKVLNTRYLKIAREAHLWTERNFYVWLDLTVDLDSQLNKLKQALPRLNIYEENLDYIDLRVGGINGEKIIFKRREI